MTRLQDPAAWRLASTLAFVVFLASWAIEGFDRVPGWGWAALVVSGALFAVELGLIAVRRRSS